jgi:BirA family biotin operon repressor/biotin-[acetyl-CoA-carboxylase] ligase
MLTEHTVAEAARVAGLSGLARFHREIGSTNTELLRMAEEGAPEWTVVAAGHQEAGRGRLGRTWVEAPGSSLLVSVLVRPTLAPSVAALITLGAGLSAAMAIEAACGFETGCKWPNDLVVRGRKLGGILVEARVEGARLVHAVIGIGVNLRQGHNHFPQELRDGATSVVIEGGRPDDAALLAELLANLRRICDATDPGFHPTILDGYRERCDTIGRTVRATTSNGNEVEGRANGIGDGGELLVETPSGVASIGFGAVIHVD